MQDFGEQPMYVKLYKQFFQYTDGSTKDIDLTTNSYKKTGAI